MTLYDADMCFGRAVVYKTASSNLSIYIFQGNSPDFPNKRCWVEGHAGIGEKSWGVGNVNSQSNWVMLVGPCPVPHWPFSKWAPGWLTLQSHLGTLSALPPFGAAERLQQHSPSFGSFVTAFWCLAWFFFSFCAKPSLPFPWVKVEFSVLWSKITPFQKEAHSYSCSSLRFILTHFFEVSSTEFWLLNYHPFNYLMPVYHDVCTTKEKQLSVTQNIIYHLFLVCQRAVTGDDDKNINICWSRRKVLLLLHFLRFQKPSSQRHWDQILC